MAALLTSERANTDKMVQYIGECREMGIARAAAGRQRVGHVLHGGRAARGARRRHPLRAGRHQERGRGRGRGHPGRARASGGPFRSLFDFCERVDLRAVNRRVVESFIKSGCFDSPRAAARRAHGRHRPRDGGGPEAAARPRAGAVEPVRACWAAEPRRPPRAPERVPDVADWPEGERLAYEKESLGFFITGHPLERYRAELAQWANATTGTLAAAWASSEVDASAGSSTGLRLIKTKKGDRMATLRARGPRGRRRGAGLPRDLQEGGAPAWPTT